MTKESKYSMGKGQSLNKKDARKIRQPYAKEKKKHILNHMQKLTQNG